MMHKMPGQLDSLKLRKRKSSSRKASTTPRSCVKSPKVQPAAESSLLVCCYGPLERLSRISCECHHQSADRRRCSASPELEGQEGKENALRTWLDLDSCSRVNWNKRESENRDCEETSKIIMFPDDDSNQILPVEQFFGNLDVVQDFPQRSPANSARVPRENRRQRYYAPEDSDEDKADPSSMQRDDT